MGRIADELDDAAGDEAGGLASHDEVGRALRNVAEDLNRRIGGEERSSPPAANPESPLLHHRVLEELRVHVLRLRSGADLDVSDSEVLEAVELLESCREELVDRPGHSAARRLLAPGAFQTVVEIAHDLRSPLGSILFLTEALYSGQRGSVSDRQRHDLGLVYAAALELRSIVEDLMETAKSGFYRDTKGEPVRFSIRELFETLRRTLQPIAESKGNELRFELPEYEWWIGHPGPVGRTLRNLAVNGLRFTEGGEVVVSARQVDVRRMEFAVRDTGPGIPEERRAELFDAFGSSASEEQSFSSSGLGLYVARRLVDALGSELRYETEVGTGTRFHFRLEVPPGEQL